MTTRIKYLILGGGPSGLSLASKLKQLGETSFLILEKENEPGGLCRSIEIDGSPLDIGGGHFLDSRNRKVLDFVYNFMPEDEWNRFDRISKIKTLKFEIDYPYEANIWQLPVEDQFEHLISILNAGWNKDQPQPEKFSEWITWKLGNVIADNYMLPYNSKIFANIDLNELGTYWLHKLPNVTFEDTLKSCLTKKPQGTIPAHAQFFYPKRYGYGELFHRMAEFIGRDAILLNYEVSSINPSELTVNNELKADLIITTIPWPELIDSESIPSEIKLEFSKLKHSSIDVTYRSKNQSTTSHWTYFPDPNLPFHRVLYRYNFIENARGYWEETNSLRTDQNDPPTHHNKFAYPLNTIEKPQSISTILHWAKSQSIIGLGRWGEWEHMNSDVAMDKAIRLAEVLTNA